MSTLLLFLIATAGMTNIVIEADFPLVKWVREKVEASSSTFLQDLWSCHMCMGWWCGLLMALLLFPAGWWTFPLACAGSVSSPLWKLASDSLFFYANLKMREGQLAEVALTEKVKKDA